MAIITVPARVRPLSHQVPVPPAMTTACLDCHRMHRRDVLRAGGLSLFGLSYEHLLRGRAQAEKTRAAAASSGTRSFGRARSCILLFMWGGPAHQDTWDLKPHAPAEVRGEFAPIGTSVPGIDICEHFPLL